MSNNAEGSSLQSHSELWNEGKDFEIDFWAEWIKSRGSEWPEDFKNRCDPSFTLFHPLTTCANAVPRSVIRILDVGAGPLTVIGKIHPGKTLEITAIDPLADKYNALLDQSGVSPLVQTRFGEAEKISTYFPSKSFDIVYAQNSIDHSYDAVSAIDQMFDVTAMGGFVVLKHFENEATQASWGAFHQWNFSLRDGAFIVADQTTSVNMTERFAGRAKIETEQAGRMITVTMQRY